MHVYAAPHKDEGPRDGAPPLRDALHRAVLRGLQGGGQGRRVRAPAAPRAELAERGAPPQAQDHDVRVFIRL